MPEHRYDGKTILCGLVFWGERSFNTCLAMLTELEEQGYTCTWSPDPRERSTRSHVAQMLKPILKEKRIPDCDAAKRMWKCYVLNKAAYAAIADFFENALTPRRLPPCLEKKGDGLGY